MEKMDSAPIVTTNSPGKLSNILLKITGVSTAIFLVIYLLLFLLGTVFPKGVIGFRIYSYHLGFVGYVLLFSFILFVIAYFSKKNNGLLFKLSVGLLFLILLITVFSGGLGFFRAFFLILRCTLDWLGGGQCLT